MARAIGIGAVSVLAGGELAVRLGAWWWGDDPATIRTPIMTVGAVVMAIVQVNALATDRSRLSAEVARLATVDAELAHLRGRLRPHFLFNSLNSIASLISIDPISMSATLAKPQGGLTLGASLTATHDPYLAVGRLDFDRQANVRVGLLPTVGVVTRLGARERWDLFGALQAGPELLHSALEVSTARVSAERRTVVSLVANLKGGMRLGFSEHTGGVLSLTIHWRRVSPTRACRSWSGSPSASVSL